MGYSFSLLLLGFSSLLIGHLHPYADQLVIIRQWSLQVAICHCFMKQQCPLRIEKMLTKDELFYF